MPTFGLLGAGFIGQVHARNLHEQPDVNFAFVYDRDQGRSAALAATYGAVPAATAEEIIENPDVDAVLIASSTDTHADLLVRAAEAGKAVLCEKPIDLTLEVAAQAVERVRATGCPPWSTSTGATTPTMPSCAPRSPRARWAHPN